MSFIKQILGQIAASVAVLAMLVAPIAIPVSAQIDIPDVCPASGCPGGVDENNIDGGRDGITSVIITVAQSFAFIIVAISAFFLVYGGFLFVTDNGDGKRAGNGKQIIFNALIGLVIAILAVTIVTVVANLVNGDLLGGLQG